MYPNQKQILWGVSCIVEYFETMKINAFLMDMDGILYQGPTRLPYVLEFLQEFIHIPTVFVTNNPIRSPEAVCKKLSDMGIGSVTEEQIITSAIATGRYLSQQKKNYRFFAVGASGLHDELQKTGIEDHIDADYVVVGEGAGLDFHSLTTGINLILKKGAILIGTNPDTTVDHYSNGQHQVLPGGGALIAPFVKATLESTGKQPIIIGKPEPLLYQMALKKLNFEAEQCLMIGDRPDTDIAGAASLGIKTALVRTGRFEPNTAYPKQLPIPDYDCDNLQQLMNELNPFTG